jgi:hypothetical protein
VRRVANPLLDLGLMMKEPTGDALDPLLRSFVPDKLSPARFRRRGGKTWSRSRGQGQGWGGLVMERASSSFSLGRQAPVRRRTLIPSTLLRGTPRAEALRSFYILV